MSEHALTLLTIGGLIGAAGATVVNLVRSEMYDRWAERQETKAERIIGLPVDPHPTPVADFDADVFQSLAIAAHADQFVRRLAPVAPVVPLQRKAGE